MTDKEYIYKLEGDLAFLAGELEQTEPELRAALAHIVRLEAQLGTRFRWPWDGLVSGVALCVVVALLVLFASFFRLR